MKINRLKRTARKHEKGAEGRLDDLFDEDTWWDQASLLVQVGVLDPGNLPVRGVEQARELLPIAQSKGLVSAKESNN